MEKYNIKHIPREDAAKIGREALEDMLKGGKTEEHVEVRALWTLVDHAETMDDKTTAGACLILGGVLCAALALACALAGCGFIFKHYIDSAEALLPYCKGFSIMPILCFGVVRLIKTTKKKEE
jgi:hypothetical protein